jgi:hypothetical protein
MKQIVYEARRRKQREYHRSHPWKLSAGGLYVPHAYFDMTPDSLSCWDDVGFILNGRRIMVNWRHPRNVYSAQLEEIAWQEVGDGPRDNWLTEGGTKNYRKIGRSRKKLISYTSREPSPAQKAHYALLNATIARLSGEGTDFEVAPSWTWKRTNWAMSVSLTAPLEVRDEQELAHVAQLALRLIKWQTTLESEFPRYRYGREDWIHEYRQLAKATEAF